MDSSDYYSTFIFELIKTMADESEPLQRLAWDCLNAVTKTMTDRLPYISSVSHAFRMVKLEPRVAELGVIPGFCHTKRVRFCSPMKKKPDMKNMKLIYFP